MGLSSAQFFDSGEIRPTKIYAITVKRGYLSLEVRHYGSTWVRGRGADSWNVRDMPVTL